jgi:2-polyprenyl-3-methyl-5-hydroxy-6-metoxy-1,4-benzoquinol methylase
VSPFDPRARRVLRRYRALPPKARLYVALRLLSCPFEAVLAALPARGTLLDVGCGSGVLCHLAAAQGLTAVGVDPDPRKVKAARASTTGGEPVTFVEGTLDDAPPGPFDAVAFVDVLYLEPPEAQRRLLDAACRRLAPGGRLLVKTVHRRSRLKTALTQAQEHVAVRGLRYTQGRAVRAPTPEAVRAVLEAHALTVTEAPVDRGYPHPHLLIVGERSR